MNRRTAVICLLLSGGLTLGQADTHAQSASDRAAADALFEEGIRLRNAGDHRAACDRFQRSQSIDPALGTVQNIGMCLEEQRKLILALSTFQQLLDEAEQAKDGERIRVAQERLKGLHHKVPKLQISVPEGSRVPGLEIFLNNAPVQDALLGFSAPVDPGRYTISARAPRHQHWSQTVVLAEKQRKKVAIPKLIALKDVAKVTTKVARPPASVEKDEANEQVAALVEDENVDEEITATAPVEELEHAGKVVGRVGVTIGPSFFSIGDLDPSPQPAFALDAAWRARDGDAIVEVGGVLGTTAFSWSANGKDSATRLLSIVANVSYSRLLAHKWRLRAQGGAGTLVLLGLEEVGNPVLRQGIRSDGAVFVAHIRVALGLEYAVAPRLQLLVSPLVYWYSPRLDQFEMNIDSLSGLQSIAGVSYLF